MTKPYFAFKHIYSGLSADGWHMWHNRQKRLICLVKNNEKSLKKVLTNAKVCGNICKHSRERQRKDVSSEKVQKN